MALMLLLLPPPDAAPLLMLCVRARGKKMPTPSAVDGLASGDLNERPLQPG